MKTILYYAGQIVHPFFKEQYRNHPEEILSLYDFDSKSETLRTDFRKLHRLRKPLESLNRTLRTFIPRLNWHQVHHDDPNILIHSAQRLIRPPYSYVVDFEQIGAFGFHDQKIMTHPRYRSRLIAALRDPRLKVILPWTKMAQSSLIHWLNGDSSQAQIMEKTQVLYPAIAPRTKEIKRKSKLLHLLFVGSPFLHKGGHETIEAFKVLKSNNTNCQLTVVTKCPIDPSFREIPGLTILSRVSSEKLSEIFQTADILIMPQHLDTLGFVLMEAFAWGIPVVTTRNFSTPEIVSNQQNGMIVDNPESFWDAQGIQRYRWWQDTGFEKRLRELVKDRAYIQSISESIVKIAANIEFFSQNALKTVTTGALSFNQRNKRLAAIYEGIS